MFYYHLVYFQRINNINVTFSRISSSKFVAVNHTVSSATEHSKTYRKICWENLENHVKTNKS